MKINLNVFRYIILVLLLLVNLPATADVTQRGKIIATQGHITPNCRMVLHQENASGVQRWFRIPEKDQNGSQRNDISAVALSALLTGKDTTIFFDPLLTTGCGQEPEINYITIYQ